MHRGAAVTLKATLSEATGQACKVTRVFRGAVSEKARWARRKENLGWGQMPEDLLYLSSVTDSDHQLPRGQIP